MNCLDDKMLYKDMKAMILSPDCDNDFSDIVTRILQRDTLAQFQLMICLHYVR